MKTLPSIGFYTIYVREHTHNNNHTMSFGIYNYKIMSMTIQHTILHCINKKHYYIILFVFNFKLTKRIQVIFIIIQYIYVRISLT